MEVREEVLVQSHMLLRKRHDVTAYDLLGAL